MALAFLPPLVVLQIVFNGFNIAIENTPRLLWPMPRCTRVCLCLSCVYPVCILCVSCVYASSLPPPTPPPHTPSLTHTHPRRLSVVRWGFEGLAINEMRGLALKCDLPPLRKVVLPTHVIPLTKSPDQESLADQS